MSPTHSNGYFKSAHAQINPLYPVCYRKRPQINVAKNWRDHTPNNKYNSNDLLTIYTLISPKLVDARIIFQLPKVVDVLTSAGDDTLGAIAYQIWQQQQRLIITHNHLVPAAYLHFAI